MTNLLNEAKQVTEVNFASEAQKLINDGWTLTGVFQRSAVYDNNVEANPVYVLVKSED